MRVIDYVQERALFSKGRQYVLDGDQLSVNERGLRRDVYLPDVVRVHLDARGICTLRLRGGETLRIHRILGTVSTGSSEATMDAWGEFIWQLHQRLASSAPDAHYSHGTHLEPILFVVITILTLGGAVLSEGGLRFALGFVFLGLLTMCILSLPSGAARYDPKQVPPRLLR